MANQEVCPPSFFIEHDCCGEQLETSFIQNLTAGTLTVEGTTNLTSQMVYTPPSFTNPTRRFT